VPQGDPGRPILFGLVVLALVASALVLALGTRRPVPAPSSAPSVRPAASGLIAPRPTSGAPAPAEPSRPRSPAATTARRFLPAYLRYEVGDLARPVARALRASATPQFAAALLGAPPRPIGGGPLPGPARLRRFRVRVAAGAPGWGELSGTAERGGHIERLTFVLERRGTSWLVTGVGE
jgi:hypothetical protein